MIKVEVGNFYRFVTNYSPQDDDSIMLVDSTFPFDEFEADRSDGYVDVVHATQEEIEYAKWCIRQIKRKDGKPVLGGFVSGMKYWLEGK